MHTLWGVEGGCPGTEAEDLRSGDREQAAVPSPPFQRAFQRAALEVQFPSRKLQVPIFSRNIHFSSKEHCGKFVAGRMEIFSVSFNVCGYGSLFNRI